MPNVSEVARIEWIMKQFRTFKGKYGKSFLGGLGWGYVAAELQVPAKLFSEMWSSLRTKMFLVK